MSAAIAITGWSSAALLLGAYALLSMRKLESDGTAFQLLNGVGAAGLATNAAANGAWASTVVNILWIAIALAAAGHRRLRTRQRSVQAEISPVAALPMDERAEMPAVLSNSMAHPGAGAAVSVGR